mmetsp:Transcript_31280/g.74922  ORF Transcript_31280/g.74922 Transcript_31280/m.74922 type:complete len:140 (-) Transcript_31280:168-587(-)
MDGADFAVGKISELCAKLTDSIPSAYSVPMLEMSTCLDVYKAHVGDESCSCGVGCQGCDAVEPGLELIVEPSPGPIVEPSGEPSAGPGAELSAGPGAEPSAGPGAEPSTGPEVTTVSAAWQRSWIFAAVVWCTFSASLF